MRCPSRRSLSLFPGISRKKIYCFCYFPLGIFRWLKEFLLKGLFLDGVMGKT